MFFIYEVDVRQNSQVLIPVRFGDNVISPKTLYTGNVAINGVSCMGNRIRIEYNSSTKKLKIEILNRTSRADTLKITKTNNVSMRWLAIP